MLRFQLAINAVEKERSPRKNATAVEEMEE